MIFLIEMNLSEIKNSALKKTSLYCRVSTCLKNTKCSIDKIEACWKVSTGSFQNEGNDAAFPPPIPNEENTFLNKNEFDFQYRLS